LRVELRRKAAGEAELIITNGAVVDRRQRPWLHEHNILDSAITPTVVSVNATNAALKLLLFNLCSINNKSALICDLIKDNSIDVLVATEIWHSTDVALCFAAPSDYFIIDAQKPVQPDYVVTNHRGLAVFHYSLLRSRLIQQPFHPTTLELLMCTLKTGTSIITCAAVYRPVSRSLEHSWMNFLHFLKSSLLARALL
jgi:hypothetical protein